MTPGNLTQTKTSVAGKSRSESKLILVEGIPGSGKTTMARFVSDRLEQYGMPSNSFLRAIGNFFYRTKSSLLHPLCYIKSSSSGIDCWACLDVAPKRNINQIDVELK